MTDEERHLWYDCLKKLSVTVRRQHIIGNYIVDFYIPSAGLVIELDGAQHFENEGIENDVVRDNYMREHGLTVARCTNTDINRNFPSVCEDIWNRLHTDLQAVEKVETE